jgi:membrane fusion protein, multidrug efflux system
MMAEKNRGDRIVQIILLLMIAAGISLMIFLNISDGDSGKGSSRSTAYAGGRPSSSPEDSQRPATDQRPADSSARSRNAVAVETYKVKITDVNQYIKVNGDVTVETSVEIYSDTNGKLVSRKISLGDRIRKDEIIASVDPSLPGQNYSASTVRSTISGTIIELPLQVGDKVTTSSPIATIGDLDDLVILTYIPERFVSTLKKGLTASVTLDALPGESFKASITEINPVMDANTRTLSVKLKLIKRDSRIRPGMFSTMKLITRESLNTLAVPSQALFSYYGESAVYVIDEEGLARRRLITTGLSSDEQIEIIDGVRKGELVITQGQNKLTDGTAVRSVDLEASL